MDAQNKYRRIVIKVGSNVLTRDDGRPDTTRISALVDQVARLHRAGTEVILVSSGAVASGRSILGQRAGKLDSVSARQLFSAVGQVKLLNRYYDLFNEYGIVCGQVLTTKESLSTRRQYLNQRNCMETMLANGVLPIVNENDTISVTELMFTDNDELSGLVAAMMNAEALIILSNIDGIYDGSPADPASQVIRRVKPSEDLSQYIDPVRSSRGRGGMATKSRVSSRAAAEGIEVIIANGRRDGILTDLVLTGEEVPCTRFEPAPRAASGVKKWIASSEGFAKGILRRRQQGRQHPRRGRHSRRRRFRTRRPGAHPLARRGTAGRGTHLVRQRHRPPQYRTQRAQAPRPLRLPLPGITDYGIRIPVQGRPEGRDGAGRRRTRTPRPHPATRRKAPARAYARIARSQRPRH